MATIIGVTEAYKEMLKSCKYPIDRFDHLFPLEVSRPWPNQEIVALPFPYETLYSKEELYPINECWLIITE